MAAVLAVLASYLSLLALVLVGFNREGIEDRGTFLLAAVAMALPSVFTIGLSRLHQPILVLLLPVAAHGLLGLVSGVQARNSKRRFGALVPLGSVALVLGVTLSSLPHVVSLYLIPSSYYAPLFERLDRTLGTSTEFSDRVLLRRRSADASDSGAPATQPITISLVDDRQRLLPNRASELVWPVEQETVRLDIVSTGDTRPTLRLRAGSSESAVASPIEREQLRRWRSSGLPGIEFRWDGGGPSPR